MHNNASFCIYYHFSVHSNQFLHSEHSALSLVCKHSASIIHRLRGICRLSLSFGEVRTKRDVWLCDSELYKGQTVRTLAGQHLQAAQPPSHSATNYAFKMSRYCRQVINFRRHGQLHVLYVNRHWLTLEQMLICVCSESNVWYLLSVL